VASTVDEYIAGFAPEIQARLADVRAAIHAALPQAPEAIRYGMPAVLLGGRGAVYFAAWKRHIGFYPVPRYDAPFEDEIAPYRAEKDTLQFPHSERIPADLIERISARLAERYGEADPA
jgi:uncharacterized protein YdhG (YjbR/CyaY superfamily)